MLRQPLVDERVVGGHQIEHAAILGHDAADEQLELALERLSQVVVEVGKVVLVRRGVAKISDLQPLPGEVVHQRARAWIGEHPANLRVEHGRLAELTATGDVEQFVIGNAAPQKE